MDCKDWKVEGNFLQWDYTVTDSAGRIVMQASKELFHWTDTYVIELERPEDSLLSLMIVLAIDAAEVLCKGIAEKGEGNMRKDSVQIGAGKETGKPISM